MRKVLAVALAAAMCAAFTTPAVAAGGTNGNHGHHRLCPPKSKNPGGHQPCGIDHHFDVTCPPKSKNPGGHPPCGIDHNGGGGGGDGGGTTPPPGNCTQADVVLLTPTAKIVCLYFGANAPNATTDCPDGLVRLAVDEAVGACVFLPPASD